MTAHDLHAARRHHVPRQLLQPIPAAAATTRARTTTRPRTTARDGLTPAAATVAPVVVAAPPPAGTLPNDPLLQPNSALVIPTGSAGRLPAVPIVSAAPSSAVPSNLAALASSVGGAKLNTISGGAIAGIVVASLCALFGLMAFLTYCLIRHRRRRAEERGWWAVGGSLNGRRGPDTSGGASSTEQLVHEKRAPLPERDPSINYITPTPVMQQSGGLLDTPRAGDRSTRSWASRFGLGGSLKRLMSNKKSLPKSPQVVLHDADGNDSERAEVASERPMPRESSQVFAHVGEDADKVDGTPGNKKDTVLDFTSAYGSFGPQPRRASQPGTSTPRRKSGGISKTHISRPSVDSTSRTWETEAALERGISQSSHRSRRASVSSNRAAPLQPRDINADQPVAPAPVTGSIKRKPAPVGLGIGHPNGQPLLIGTAGPSTNKHTSRKLSPVLEIESLNTSTSSSVAPLRVTAEVTRPPIAGRAPSATRMSSLQQARRASLAAASQPRRVPHKPPPLIAPQPLHFQKRPVVVDGMTTPEPPPLSPFVTESAERVSISESSASLVRKPQAPKRSATLDSEVSTPSTDGGAFGIGTALMRADTRPPSRSPSIASTPGPITPSLGELAVAKQDPNYKSATWSIYDAYGKEEEVVVVPPPTRFASRQPRLSIL